MKKCHYIIKNKSFFISNWNIHRCDDYLDKSFTTMIPLRSIFGYWRMPSPPWPLSRISKSSPLVEYKCNSHGVFGALK